MGMTGQALKDLSRPVWGFVDCGGGENVLGLFYEPYVVDGMQATENHTLPQPGERGCWK